MADDLTKRGKPDKSRIDIHEPYELRDWANRFGVPKSAVIDAVHAVGVMAADVEKYLRQKAGIR